MAQTPSRVTKRIITYPEHLNILDNFIADQAESMADLNKYIEDISHPNTTFSIVTDSRDHVRKALRSLQAVRLVIASYEEDSAV